MDNSNVKDSMVLYHLGYEWSTDDNQIWSLHDSDGEVVYKVNKVCFPQQGNDARAFTHKCAILLPDIREGYNFELLFGIYKGMSSTYNNSFKERVVSIEDAFSIREFCDSVINSSIDCIFGGS